MYSLLQKNISRQIHVTVREHQQKTSAMRSRFWQLRGGRIRVDPLKKENSR